MCVCKWHQTAPTVILISWVSGSRCKRRREGGKDHDKCEIDRLRMNTKMFTVHHQWADDLIMMTLTVTSVLTVHVEEDY